MARKEQPSRLFTIEEANRLIPQLKPLLRRLREHRDQIQRLETAKAVEELSWLEPDGSVSPKAQREMTRLQAALGEQVKSFESRLEELNGLGGQLKDLEEGLVDFFTGRGEVLVYLCWKEGEEQIRYWHDLESGFAGRRLLEEL
jgi:hypothetical protein